MSTEKVIFHMDGDAFFVGVEVAKNPKLKGLPVVTGAERGIASALSYEAKALGIKRGMSIYKIKKDFPKVIILPGDYASYAQYSGMMFDIVRRYADGIEEYSIDECFADLTGLDRMHKLTYREMAEHIKKEVEDELGLSVSIGLAPTKVLAKVASKWQKPNGLTIITRDTIQQFLDKTSIGNIWGIGPKTAESLRRNNIKTAGEFIAKNDSWIRSNLSKPYETLWQELQGISIMDIDTETKDTYSSIQKTRTFNPSTSDKDFLLSELSKHLENACIKARHYNLIPHKLSFFLKTTQFKIYSHTVTLHEHTNTPQLLMKHIHDNFDNVFNIHILYRTAGVTLSDLRREGTTQSDLFGESLKTDKYKDIYERVDSINEKFGRHTVHLASTHASLTKDTEGTDADDLDRDLLFL